MSFALSAGVTGLQAHQKMLDVAGNNLANINTTAFKASRVTFSELLSETIKSASAPTTLIGGTNPQQMSSGVAVSGITPNMAQGNIVNTGNPLDLAMEGEGYFVLSDGPQKLYTRVGTFAVDAASKLVDPATGYRVQRTGDTGVSEGFQSGTDTDIQIPYDQIPASKTTQITVQGNLSADGTLPGGTQTQVITSDITYKVASTGANAVGGTELDLLERFSGSFTGDGNLKVTGYQPNGTAITDAVGLDVDTDTTLTNLIAYIQTKVGAGNATVSLVNGRIVVTDVASGYSRTDLVLAYSDAGSETTLTMPGYFEISTVGGEEVKNINITTYDSLGGQHVISGVFVRRDGTTPATPNTWDMLLTSITGDIYEITPDNRRIRSIEFNETDGSFKGLNTTIDDDPEFVVTYQHDTANAQTMEVAMGTTSQFDGLTQFAGSSTAVAREQNGYEAGSLSAVSVDNEGTVIGSFSNGIKRNIAVIQIALFQNAAALESAGGGYYIPSANSGKATETQAMGGGAGTLHGGALEKSNADIASEFVTMIQAQNGFQANARTIRVANDVLRELTNLIR